MIKLTVIGRFPLATNEVYLNKTTNEKITSTEWLNLVVRNKAAEICEKYLFKGDKIFEEDRIKSLQWQAKYGSAKYTTEIQVTEFTFLITKKSTFSIQNTIMSVSNIKILHIDSNHPLLWEQLQELGFTNHQDFTSSKQEIEAKIQEYQGIVIRSRFKIDKTFLDKATNLEFIARVGAGLESIDCDYALSKNISLIAAPEGNSNAVGEHALGMLL